MRFELSRALGAGLLASALLGAGAQAATVGFSGTMGGAALGLTNTSTSASIVKVTITIGDAAFHFDDINLAGDATIVQPDTVNGSVRSDVTEVTFTSFGPGEVRNFPWDIDPDAGDSGCCGVSGVLINNGAAPNAVVTVDFSTGHQLVYVLPDSQVDYDDPFASPSACISSLSCVFPGMSVTVPEPSPAVLLWLALASVGAVALRRS
jgi:hypothetical protein